MWQIYPRCTEWEREEKDLHLARMTQMALRSCTHYFKWAFHISPHVLWSYELCHFLSLSTRCLTRNKTKPQRRLKTNPSSCPASINHLWYTVDTFFENFRPLLYSLINWVVKSDQNGLKIQMSFVSGPEYSRDLLSWTSCHRFLFFPPLSTVTLRHWGAAYVKFTTSRRIRHSQSANTANLLFYQPFCQSATAFLHLLCFIREERGAHTLHCVRPKAVRQASVLIRSE